MIAQVQLGDGYHVAGAQIIEHRGQLNPVAPGAARPVAALERLRTDAIGLACAPILDATNLDTKHFQNRISHPFETALHRPRFFPTTRCFLIHVET